MSLVMSENNFDLKINFKCTFKLKRRKIGCKMSTKFFLNLLQKNTNAIRSYSYSSVITTNKENLTGVFPQLTTPFTRLRSEQVAWKELEDNLFRLNSSQPFGGYVVNGFYGENPHLNTKERVDIVKVVRKIVGKKKTILVSHNSDC